MLNLHFVISPFLEFILLCPVLPLTLRRQMATSSVSLGPISASDRISSIDVLRGFAVLGILVMNIQSFSMPFAAYFNPTAFGDFTGINFRIWQLGRLFADQKFMTIFSLLFGASTVLLTSRFEAASGRSARIYYRRTFWLLVFGLIHAYLIWYGDILVLYAVCGILIYCFRKLSPTKLFLIGLIVVALGSAISFGAGWSMPNWPPSEFEKLKNEQWAPPPDALAAEIRAYQGDWPDQLPHRVRVVIGFHSFVIWIWGIWRAGGLMLMGMALFKWGVFSARRSLAFYATMLVLGFAIGLPLILAGIRYNFAHDWDIRFCFFFGDQFNYWGSLFVSAAWIGLVMLICKSSSLVALTKLLAAAGRMAFTCYLFETLIATTLFYGHGFGLFARVDRLGQQLITLSICVFLLLFSSLWLSRFQYGPFEWLWRSLTYWQRQPLRFPSSIISPGAVSS